MIAEGWDGKSIRQHVERAEADAADAQELAESAHDEIAALRAELAELAARFGWATSAEEVQT
jgi:F0F1-type ATP synthase membrane subunit b/b'